MPDEFVYFGSEQLFWGSDPITLGNPSPAWDDGLSGTVPPGAVWTWVFGPGASSSDPGPTRELTSARGRVSTWRVDGHPFAQFSIDGRSDDASQLVERRDDIWVYREGALVFRGRVVGAEDTIDPTSHRVQFLAVGYRGLLSLAAKVEPPVPTFNDVDQAQIPWQLIQAWQARPGGNWGIVEGVGSTSGTTRDENQITPFSPVGEVIDRILRRDGGGEWDISPDLELDRWWPARGTDNGVVLDYGGVISNITRSLPEFGNVGGASGNDQTTPVAIEHAGVATDERGRWTVATASANTSRQASVVDKAQWTLDQAYSVESTWQATFTARRWEGPDHVWIGDTVELRVDSGRLQVAGPHRVVELQAVCGDDGTETITVGLVGVA